MKVATREWVRSPTSVAMDSLNALQDGKNIFVLQSRVLNPEARCYHLGYWNDGTVDDGLHVWMYCLSVSALYFVTWEAALERSGAPTNEVPVTV
jgi:hypothetical protein